MNKMINKYVNRFGESWWFMYDPNKNIAYLTCDDDLLIGELFYVKNGLCRGIIMSQDERDWLIKAWNDAIEFVKQNV